MSFVSKEIRRFGYIVVNDVQVLAAQYHFECDSASDLPTQTQFQNDKNVFLFMGSTAHTIDTDKKYELNSSGTWTQQSQPWQPLADYSVLTNKPQINGNVLIGNQSGADLGLQNTLTFDSTPTQDSTNPVTSGGIRTDQQRQDMMQDEDRAALVELVDGGAKNLAKNDPSSTSSDITVSLSADGKLVINGNSGSIAQSVYCTCYLDAGTYVLSGCPSGGGTSNYQCELRTTTGAATGYADTGDTVTFTITSAGYYRYNVRIAAGYTATNLTIPAMICSAAAWKISQTFQPYRPSWQEMWDMIQALQ